MLDLKEKDGGLYWCEAIFLELGESRGKASLKVLTYMEPLKPFLAIAAEVIILVALIFIYEIYTKKKEPVAGKTWKKYSFQYAFKVYQVRYGISMLCNMFLKHSMLSLGISSKCCSSCIKPLRT